MNIIPTMPIGIQLTPGEIEKLEKLTPGEIKGKIHESEFWEDTFLDKEKSCSAYKPDIKKHNQEQKILWEIRRKFYKKLQKLNEG